MKQKTKDYKEFLRLLRLVRKESKLTQVDLAHQMSVRQTLISKIETGERRLDVVELIYYCESLSIDPSRFIRRLQSSIKQK